MLNLWSVIKGLLVQEESDRTKELSVEVASSATTNTRTTLRSSQTANRTIDLPDADDTLVGKDTVDTLTNKTIDLDAAGNSLSNVRDAEIAADADIARSKIAPGSADHVLINDASGELSSEAVLSPSRGGTGADLSAADGLVQYDSGVFSDKQVKIDDTGSSDITTLDVNATVARTLTLPDADDTLVARDTTDTLTNKTLDGTSATGTNTITADADNITYDNTTSSLVATDVQAAVDEVEGRVDTAEADITNLELALPSGDDFLQLEELVADPATPSAGTKRIFARDDDKLYQINSAGLVSELGAGSGGAAGRIYFEDRDANDISNLSLYNDGGAVPTDGDGGTPNITSALNTSTPIIGDSSYRVSKTAVNRQGEGFTIETDVPLDAPVTAGEPLTVQFRYRTSANYADGDIRMYYYLVGDNELFALNGVDNRGVFGNDLNKEDGDRGQFTASINATSATTSVRIIGHIASTNATAYDIDIDEITVGTAATLTSPIVTEPESFNPTTSGLGTIVSSDENRWWRVGNVVHVQGRLERSTAAAASAAQVGLPNGWTGKAGFSRRIIGQAYNDESANFRKQFSVHIDAGNNVVQFGELKEDLSANAASILQGNQVLPTGVTVLYYMYSVEVEELDGAQGSNIVSQTQAAFATPSFRVDRNNSNQTSAAIYPGPVKVEFNSFASATAYQRGGANYDTSSHRFIATSPGVYQFSARAAISGAGVLNVAHLLFIRKNNSGTTDIRSDRPIPAAAGVAVLQAEGQFELDTGDFVEVFVSGDTTSANTVTIGGFNGDSYFSGYKVQDLSVVGLAGQRTEYLSSNQPEISATGGNGTFIAMSGNELTLSPGEWELSGCITWRDTTSANTNILRVRADWYGADGNNTSTTPTLVSALSGATVVSQFSPLVVEDGGGLGGGFVGQPNVRPVNSMILRLTETQTIYLVMDTTANVPGNGRYGLDVRARRLK